jgi:hypothetical protein
MPTEAELYQQFQREKEAKLRAQFEAEKAAKQRSYKKDDIGALDQFGLGVAESALKLGNVLGIVDDKKVQDLSQYNQGSGWSTAGNIAGEIAGTAIPGGLAGKAAIKVLPKALQVAKGAIPSAVRLAGAGAAGGAAGEAMVGRDPVSGAAGGALFGPAMGALGHGADALWTGAKKLTAGARGRATEELKNLFGDRVPMVTEELRNLSPYVEGEVVTAGKAANANIPELKVLEEGARSRPGGARFTAADEANRQARLRAVEQHAVPGRPAQQAGPNEPVAYSPLEQARKAETDPLYAAAKMDEVKVTPSLRETLTGAQVEGARRKGERAYSQAQTNAAVAGRPVPPSTHIPGPRSYPRTTIGELQPVKNEMSARIKQLEGATDAASINERNNLIEARRQLSDQMKRQSKKYAKASDKYAEHMKLQNQADVAEQLVTALRNPVGNETRAAYQSAMENAPRTLKRAGVPRYDRIEEVATPQQMADYRNVGNSVQREANYLGLDAPSGLVPEFLSPYEKIEGALPPIFSQAVTTAKKILNKVGRRSDEQVQQIIADAIYNPQQMDVLLNSMSPSDAGKFISALRKAGGGTTGAITGTSFYSPQTEE